MSAPAAIVKSMLTTITINGTEGYRFLARLGGFEGRLPPALAAMVDQTSTPHEDTISIEVESRLADEVAAFVDELVHAGFGETALPLLFSAQPGDLVIVVRDALVEVQVGKRESRTWQHVPRGTRGRFVARRGDTGKVLLLDGARETAFISDRSMTRARPVVQRQLLGK
jgi:hypothetical protein